VIMRVAFVGILVFIAAGLSACIVLGLAQR
jgi:hypothetical protein